MSRTSPSRPKAWRLCACVLCAAMALGSCGDSPAPAGHLSHPIASAVPMRTAASLYGVVSAAEAVEQLLDYAELMYPQVAPSHRTTATWGKYRFRFYPETGVYLAVAVGVTASDHLVESGVYAMGGPFGSTPIFEGKLLSLFTPVLSELAAAPGLAATYVDNLPFTPRGTGAACSDRAAWSGAAAKVTDITSQADALLSQSFPAWDQNLYTNDPFAGETMMAARKAWLYPLVIAECASWQGKYLAAIRTTLRELATEPTWISPNEAKKYRPPDWGPWFMDLMSAAMAHELAQSLYLLGDRVDAETRSMVLAALETRVFTPVRRTLAEGIDGWWLTATHNWNAVILAGVTGAALTVLPSRHDRARFAAMGQHYIASSLSEFPESGYGIEGPGYWAYGVKHFSVLRHRLYESSGGRVDLFRTAKAQAIGLYGVRFEMTPLRSVAPFGDSYVGTSIDVQTRAYMAAAYGTAGAWPGDVPVRVNPWHLNDMPVVEASLLLTDAVPLATGFETGDFAWPGLRSYFADVGVLVTRPAPGDPAFAVTIKSAGNANHSHDDQGSYSIAWNAITPAGDPGRGAYTSITFTDQRHTIKWINSYGHPVPMVGGRLQVYGETATNTVTSTSFTDARDEIAINLAPAYALPSGWSLMRRLRNDRTAHAITIQDDFSGFSEAQAFEVPVITTGSWTQTAADRIELQYYDARLYVQIEASAPYSIVGETVSDVGLTFQRIAIRLATPSTSGWVRVTYTR